MNKRIAWVTATYFLDVDLPVVPRLKQYFDIDWIIVTNSKSVASDTKLIQSQTSCDFRTVILDDRFYSPKCYKFYKSLILDLKRENYDWFYFDISDFFFLYPLIRRYLPASKVTIATHNVSIPRGARLAPIAKISMKYILNNFNNFHVFSKNQLSVINSLAPSSNVFYCPLMLKDYGDKNKYNPSIQKRFLFFGNILKYKRVDILIRASEMLIEKGIKNFQVSICGYCSKTEWEKSYLPLIKHPEFFYTDIRRIPNELVPSLFNNNDFFVMPYQDIAQSGAMTVALNYNMPIIASELDTFKEFLKHEENGFFFKAGSSEDLSIVMERAINMSETDYKQLKTNLQSMVDNTLSIDAIINSYVKYLNTNLNA